MKGRAAHMSVKDPLGVPPAALDLDEDEPQ